MHGTEACRLSRQIAPEQRQALYSKMATAGLFDALAVYFTGEWPREVQATGEELAVRKPAEHPAQHHAVEVLLLHAWALAWWCGFGGVEATFHPMLLRNWLTKEKNEAGARSYLGCWNEWRGWPEGLAGLGPGVRWQWRS